MPTTEQPTPNLEAPYDTKALARYFATQRTGDQNAEPTPIDHLHAVRFQLAAANDAENEQAASQRAQQRAANAQALRNFAASDDEEDNSPSPMPTAPMFSPINVGPAQQRQGLPGHLGPMRVQQPARSNPLELLARLLGRR